MFPSSSLTSYSTLAAILAVVSAGPVVRAPEPDPNVTVGDVINYALTLEHLEAAFYSQALDKFDDQSFASAGYPDWVRNRVASIASHEQEHVDFLTSALNDAGVDPTSACTYEFGVTDPATFIATASILESVGTSAYTGAAQFVANNDYLTAAASILAIEARHAAWIGSAVEKSNPWPGAFQAPLTLNQVYTIASAFITSCPDTNPALPVKAYPALAVQPDESGAKLTLSFDVPEGVDVSSLYAATLNGLDAQYTKLDSSLEVEMSGDVVCGPTFLLVTKKENSTADEDIVAGPAALRLPCTSKESA